MLIRVSSEAALRPTLCLSYCAATIYTDILSELFEASKKRRDADSIHYLQHGPARGRL